MSDGEAVSAQNVRLRFTTREGNLSLEENAPVLIPTQFRRYQLSQYINSQLKLEKPIPFEFLINGSYLRTGLDDYLTQNGVSAETTVSVEYVRARIPPQYAASYAHNDWVSDVHTSTPTSETPSRILTASYDGRIRVWNTSSQEQAASPGPQEGGHLSFVKSARFVSSSQIVSASSDRIVKLWNYSESAENSVTGLSLGLNLYGHKAGIEAVDVHGSSHRLLTASVDHSVGIWSTRKKDAPLGPEGLAPKTITRDNKKRKLNPSISVPERGPLSLMQGHTAAVSAVCFDLKDATVGYSCSLDHTVRTWHLPTASLVDTRTTTTPLFCIAQMPTIQLLATGSASREVKMVDPRASATAVVAMTLKGHKNHVVALARDPDNDYVLASGSHDGTCRIWDVRSTKNSKDGITTQSVFTIPRESLHGKAAPLTGEGIKVFGICWDAQIGILSAGEDKNVQVNTSENNT